MKITRKGITDSVDSWSTKHGYQFGWLYVFQRPLCVIHWVVKVQRLKWKEISEDKDRKKRQQEADILFAKVGTKKDQGGYWKAHGDRIMWFDHDGAEPRILR